MSTAPSDSVSNQGKKKNRPGKNARQAAKSTASAPATDSAFFSSQMPDIPVPQPGRFPIVFKTGVGEPTRDVEFAYRDDCLDDIIQPLFDRYAFNPKYAEFAFHTDYDDDKFSTDIQRQVYLGLAQQTVHAHVNMGLPLGDFSSIASTDVFQFTSLSNVIRQFGEFSDPSLGNRYLLRDYSTTIHSLVRAASLTGGKKARDRARRTVWLPTKAKDRRTTFILAKRLADYLADKLRVFLDIDELCDHLFDSSWDVFDNLKPLLDFGQPNDNVDRFDFLFTSYDTEVSFVQKFSGTGPQAVLTELGLWWDSPAQPDLAYDLVPKVRFPELVDQWARKRSAIEKFLSCTSGVANRSAAAGSQAQVSLVRSTPGVTAVHTHVALSAPELSLLACFPPSIDVQGLGPYNVVVTTSIPLKVRATEYLQGDWRG